jgi:predicted nucleic acid-binding protein
VDRSGTLVKAVVDTNVVAYLLLGTEQYVDEARAFLASLGEAHAPALWEAEITNVLWMAARQKILTIEEAISRLALADSLGIHTAANRTLWQGALVRAHRYRSLRHAVRRTCRPTTTAARDLRRSLAESLPEDRRPACRIDDLTHNARLAVRLL